MDSTIYQISSAKKRNKTKILVFGEARGTLLNLVIGEHVQTYIKIKTSDLIQVLVEMGVIEQPKDAVVHDMELIELS